MQLMSMVKKGQFQNVLSRIIRKFVFSSLMKDFNVPTSVTTSLDIAARRFAGDNGIVLQVKCKYDYKSKWNLSRALLVDWISSFPVEKETLLFGNFNQMMITNIILIENISDSEKTKYDKRVIQSINNFEQLMDGRWPKYNNKQRADRMNNLIEHELNQQCGDEYFRKIFHKICKNRTQFNWSIYQVS